ncbi:MAG TPA: enoyl-CoA hydratase/isomerase family protein [Candidatus Methylomirabilis sp.]|nr:enoyl-CoA hydratase/isomerase family protein [Candidatus Methylomirabilis sp.]
MSDVSLNMDGPVARLVLDRPEALNALNREMARHLERALGSLEAAGDVKVVIVSGRGRSFCAGNDIAEMAELSPVEAETISRSWQDIVDRFGRLPQVTIAAVHGHALGGGCVLAAAQDLRLAEASARLGLPEVTLGFNPSYGIARLLDVMGGAHGRDLLLTGRTIDATEAQRMNLVTTVVPDGTLEQAAAALASQIAQHPRAGVTATKSVIANVRAGGSGDEARAYAATLRSDAEARARIAAFIARKTRK